MIGGISVSGMARSVSAIIFLVSALACSESPTTPTLPGGVDDDLDALFAPPTSSEIAAVVADWASRDVSVQGYQQEFIAQVVLAEGTPATLRIVSHIVDGARHYGATIVPDGAAAGGLPLLVYAHGGDRGVDAEDAFIVSASLGDLGDELVYVVPSFRSETLRLGGASWTSEGEASTWDRDVDDGLALINAVLANTPAVDSTRIAILGLSRGGGVGLLMSARDARIDAVVDIFGPTDFYDTFAREIIEDALAGNVRDLPGVPMLNERYLQPFQSGNLSLDEMRRQLLLRSPAQFADRLRGVQVHHGSEDNVVHVSQAESLIGKLQALERGPPAFEFYIYAGGRHDLATLQGSAQRTVTYLGRL